jgi:uncharacterized membrane protein YhaH (DUF805 family)
MLAFSFTDCYSMLAVFNIVRSLILGRINRSRFWAGCAIVFSILALFNASGLSSPVAGWIVAFSVTFALAVLCKNRLHDLGRSCLWLALIIVPIAGAVWLAWQLGFKTGQIDANRWGDGSKPVKDFLKVA